MADSRSATYKEGRLVKGEAILVKEVAPIYFGKKKWCLEICVLHIDFVFICLDKIMM